MNHKRKIMQFIVVFSMVSTLYIPSLAQYLSSYQVSATPEENLEEEDKLLEEGPDVPSEEASPLFSFTGETKGRVNEPFSLTFVSTSEVEEATIYLPRELSIVTENLPVGISMEEIAEENYWVLKSEEPRTTFTLPLVVEEEGTYEVSVNDTEISIEIEASEEEPIEEELEKETEQEEVPEVEAEEGLLSQEESENEENVSPMAEFIGDTVEANTFEELRLAVANPEIGTIEVRSNLTRSGTGVATAIGTLNRSLVIKGNGFTIDFGADNGSLGLASLSESAQETVRLENATITKLGATALFNAAGTGIGWTLELENITEGSANAACLALIPEGSVLFTGGTNNFIRTTVTTTFLQAKHIEARGGAQVTMNRGNANYFISPVSVANPSVIVRENSKIVISTASGTNNAIALRGSNPKIVIEGNSSLELNSPGTTAVAADTSNNAISMTGSNPSLSITDNSSLRVTTTNAKRGIVLIGSTPSVTVEDSTLNVTSATAESIFVSGQDALLNTTSSTVDVTTTTGRAIRVAKKINMSKTDISITSTSGIALSIDDASGEIVIDESNINLAMSSSNSGILLSGTDSLLNVKNGSKVNLTSGSGISRNILFNGVRSKMIIEDNSELVVNTSGATSVATDTANNAIQFAGESSELTVRDQSTLSVNVISGNKRGIFFQSDNGLFQVLSDSKVDVSTNEANSVHLKGKKHTILINENAEVYLKSLWSTERDFNASLYVGTVGETEIIFTISESSLLKADANMSSAVIIEGRKNSYNIEDKSSLRLKSDRPTGSTTVNGNYGSARATLRFMESGDSEFNINNSEVVIDKVGGNAPGVRMYGNNNHITTSNAGKLIINNPGDGQSSNGNTAGGNQGIHLTSGNNTSFSVIDFGSEVRITAENGPAVDLSGDGKIINSNGGYFEASGRTSSALGGIFRASLINIEFANPLFMNFRNNRPGGGNIFNVANGSSLKATNSDMAVWGNGSNLEGDPDLNFPTLDFSFTGLNFNILDTTNKPDVLNTDTFGTAGLTTYSRLSSNNARWVIVDELRVPTNADKKIHGHISIPVGLEDSRSAWENEATVTVEVERVDGTKEEYTAKTEGHSNEEPGISIYGEEPRGGLFEVELEEYLQKGDKVKIKEAGLTSGELSQGFENIILTETVEVFPIVPPKPALFSSSIIAKDSTVIQGTSKNPEVEVTATYNDEILDTENVVVDADGNFTIDVSGLELEEEDEIQVFLRDNEGNAEIAGVVNPPETNNDKGNINPGTELIFHDVEFEPATILTVGDLGPVSPVDPLDPELEVDPDNKPEIPEDQGLLSIDFVSQFDFGSKGISVQDQTYYAQSQQLLNDDGTVNEQEERPNYVQVSDRRSATERGGWQLAVTQMSQFTGEDGQALNGAQLRLTNQELATAQGGNPPSLQVNNPLSLTPGSKRTLIRAEDDEGTGTWVYRFGNRDTSSNSVALEVPKGANPEAIQYTTTLNWELSAVPGN